MDEYPLIAHINPNTAQFIIREASQQLYYTLKTVAYKHYQQYFA